MSRTNKVNPDHYTLAGRLSPDDLARERWKQQESSPRRGRREKPLPPWMRQPAPDATGEADAPAGQPTRAATEATRPRPETAARRRATAVTKKTRTRGPATPSEVNAPRSSSMKAAAKTRAKTRSTSSTRKRSPKVSARTRTGVTGSSRAGAGAPRKARTLTEKTPARRKRSKR